MSYPNVMNYSEHFTRRELDCHCGCDAPPAIEAALAGTAAQLEKLRKLTGPIHVNSGYRCSAYNTKIGGALASQHKNGTAADISVKNLSPTKVFVLAEQVPAFLGGGIGLYDGFVHVDRRVGAARWDERTK